jgi:hypothetical protein
MPNRDSAALQSLLLQCNRLRRCSSSLLGRKKVACRLTIASKRNDALHSGGAAAIARAAIMAPE